jgi:hypothetical protein
MRRSKGFKEGRNEVAPGVGPRLASGIKWIDTRVDGGLIGWRGGGRGRANSGAHQRSSRGACTGSHGGCTGDGNRIRAIQRGAWKASGKLARTLSPSTSTLNSGV